MFYIKPPVGQVSLHVLEKCVLTRLEYLQLLYDAKSHEFNGNFEYLLENSSRDKIGHFTLRLLASTSSDLWNYWIVREVLLFQSRLTVALPRQFLRLFKQIIQQLRTFSEKEQLINRTLIDICCFLLKPSVFNHLISKDHTKDCNLYQNKVRYELIPDLIKGREVDLKAGYAVIYCSKWKEVLVSLFHTYMTKQVVHIKLQAQRTINQDHRLDYLYQKIQCRVFQRSLQYGTITVENIDSEMKKFPLCMQHLHTTLRNTHRLSHYARWYYSLFLKDSGMQLEDAISYWKQEYSKPHTCSSTCSHNWQSDSKKFVYSIRHLYGLEGSRKNYKSPNCQLMCSNIPGPMYEGGCPFKNFDISTLKNLLSTSLSVNDTATILNINSSQKPQTTCTEFFKLLSQRNNSDVISNPVEYYLRMIKQV